MRKSGRENFLLYALLSKREKQKRSQLSTSLIHSRDTRDALLRDICKSKKIQTLFLREARDRIKSLSCQTRSSWCLQEAFNFSQSCQSLGEENFAHQQELEERQVVLEDEQREFKEKMSRVQERIDLLKNYSCQIYLKESLKKEICEEIETEEKYAFQQMSRGQRFI